MAVDWSRCPHQPYAHQRTGVEALLGNTSFAIFDQVGAGKSFQVVTAICHAHHEGEIDAVVVVAPASVRSVWANPDPVLGEFAKHVWRDVDYGIKEYCAPKGELPPPCSCLPVIVTNYEFLRRANRLAPLVEWCTRRNVWLVFDESWAVKTHNAQQTKAARLLRNVCTRATLLNGTPGDPGEIYSQFAVLDPGIIGQKNFYTFRARYARMGGWERRQIVGWDRQDEFREKIKPFALQRLTHECIDLPAVSRTQIDVRLTPETWRLYVQMRDDLVAWLSTAEASVSRVAGTKVIRLAQLLSGYLGGVVSLDGLADMPILDKPREVGREKLDAVLHWLSLYTPEKAVLWGQFRAEIERAAIEVSEQHPNHTVDKLYGGIKKDARDAIKMLLAPGGFDSPAIVVAHPQAGGAGLNFAAAQIAIYMSNGFSLQQRLQSEGRLDRPGQTKPVLYVDVIASGPDGQRTLDHQVVKRLRQKEDLANVTASAWRDMLREE